jgi:predicted dehydrogenase
MTILNAAVVGPGGRARAHLPIIRLLSDKYRLVAVCDVDEGGKSYVIYEDLDLRYGGAHGIGGGSTHHIIVKDCDLLYIGGGDQFGGDRTVRYS